MKTTEKSIIENRQVFNYPCSSTSVSNNQTINQPIQEGKVSSGQVFTSTVQGVHVTSSQTFNCPTAGTEISNSQIFGTCMVNTATSAKPPMDKQQNMSDPPPAVHTSNSTPINLSTNSQENVLDLS